MVLCNEKKQIDRPPAARREIPLATALAEAAASAAASGAASEGPGPPGDW
jgi:hypothetical protein